MYFNVNQAITLKQFEECFDGVLRDCEFFCAAKVGSSIDNRVVYVQSLKYLKEVNSDAGISGVIVAADLAPHVVEELGCAISEDPAASFWELHKKLSETKNHYWQDFKSTIAESAQIHPSAVIAEKNVIIGERANIGANAVIDEKSIIGDDCFIGPLSHIGASAYELFRSDDKNILAAQAGGVLIGDNVTVLSNVAVVKSCFPTFTSIGNNVNIDNLVHVAHDCKIGEGTKVTATAILCGRVTLGKNVYIGPNATISNGINVGDYGRVTLGSVVTRDVDDSQTVSGNFAREHREFLKSLRTK